MNMKQTVLRAARMAGVFALMRVLTRKYPRILCYHGGSLGDERLYNPKLFCTPGQLRERLKWLRKKGFVPVTLDQVADGTAAAVRGIPVAVTLDDGWYSSWHDLLPLLADFGHRPALYLHTEAYKAGAPIIAVALRYLLWKAGPKAVLVQGIDPAVDGPCNLADAAQRRRLCGAAETWLAGQPHAGRASCLERLGIALGVTPAQLDLASRRFSYMTTDELHAAAVRGCSIELHGHVHEYMPGQDARNRANIEQCREVIEAAGLPSPTHYCYPSGAFDAGAPAVMQAAGVSTATTCVPGLVNLRGRNTRFFLPRFLDGGDVAMIEFEAEMSGVLQLLRTLTRRANLTAHALQPSPT
ncbi:polysaccharide deacetylase family protein [Massilia sp. CMS3.1]|uniref:polysaccharide deacetylase family protein n=1 Tax=Massilia sp. CMS3.1 TaxID=3373083 RepID=UPI003EE6DE7A